MSWETALSTAVRRECKDVEVTGSFLSLGGPPVTLPTPGFIVITASPLPEITPCVHVSTVCLSGGGKLPEDRAHLDCLLTALF